MTNDTLYRVLMFRKGPQGWGYPMPHLLAMNFAKRAQPSTEIDSEIRLYFSTQAVKIEGTSLRVLWNILLTEPPEEIVCGVLKQDGNSCIIANIEVIS